MLTLGLCFPSLASAQETTIVSVSAPSQVDPGDQFTVNITVEPGTAIAGVQCDLNFNPTLVTVDSVEEGNLLSQGGASTYFNPGYGSANGMAGAIISPGQTVSTPGTFAIITLTAGTAGGTCPLTLANVVVGDLYGQSVPVSVVNGQVTINQPPVLNPIGNKEVNEGQPLQFAISATDPDGGTLTYSAANLPQGASFNPSTRTFSWTPGSDQEGVYANVHFEVSDGSLTDSEDITITVNKASPPGPGGGGGLGGGGSSSDKTPPIIYNIAVSETTKTGADICWTTNEWSTSQVEYWASPSQLSPLNEEKVIEHKVHLTDLTPAATYHFKTLSMDKAGNLTVSDEHTFTTLGTPAAFSVSALDITPAEVDIGEEATISVLVTNSGDAAGSYEVTLKIDDVVVATEDVVDLAGGDSQKVTFTTAKDSAGMATVDVNGLGASFVVKEAPATEAPTTEINVFSVTPSYNSETGKLIFAKVICEINNLSEPATDVGLILKVSLDGEPIEEVPLIIPSQLQPGEITVSRDYIPPMEWENGTYTFQAELYVGGKSYTTTTEEKLEVTISSDAPAVSWATLGQIIGGTLIAIVATVAIILLRRRRLPKAQVFEEVKVGAEETVDQTEESGIASIKSTNSIPVETAPKARQTEDVAFRKVEEIVDVSTEAVQHNIHNLVNSIQSDMSSLFEQFIEDLSTSQAKATDTPPMPESKEQSQ